MSINLTKNKDALVAAWHNVVDDKSPVNWAVFGYEGHTNNLRVVGTGQCGLEEMIDRLSSSDIMYAFCRVIDTKTSLPKCLLINWQGEGAPIVRKGTCANHIRDVERLLKGAHITITARSEDDVEVDVIMEKLARATASSFRFNEPRGENEGHTGPIGTTYRRVIPEQEINATERDQFWQREEMEEKKRLEQERLRNEQERIRLEKEIRVREEKENQLREQKVTAKEHTVARQKLAEQRAEDANNLRNQIAVSQHHSNDMDDDHKSRSEDLRRERSKEAQQLIAQRTINARAVFEQNSAAGQMKLPSSHGNYMQKGSQVEAARRAIEKTQPKQIEPQYDQDYEEVAKEPQKVIEEEIPVNSVPVSAIVQNVIEETNESNVVDAVDAQEPVEQAAEKNAEEEAEGDRYDDCLWCGEHDAAPMTARAIYDYEAADSTEITFYPGDIITHIDAIDKGWWQGLAPDGTFGLFPANYVEVIAYDTSR